MLAARNLFNRQRSYNILFHPPTERQIMLTHRLENKLRLIILDYINGNRITAKEAIKKLRKSDLANLLVNTHEVMYLNQEDKVIFHDFIITALEP